MTGVCQAQQQATWEVEAGRALESMSCRPVSTVGPYIKQTQTNQPRDKETTINQSGLRMVLLLFY